ncbi:GGDEF domain-containing protein [Aliiglaciecola lipolytica]|nr:GGDEF domain-containing protein [Aliiglaciecola lipolytica]
MESNLTFIILVSLLLMHSGIAYIILFLVPKDSDRYHITSLFYFRSYFLFSSIGYVFFAARIAIPLELSVAATNGFALTAAYCIAYGLNWRNKNAKKFNNKLVIFHICILIIAQVSASYLYPEFFLLRLFLFYINLAAVLLYALSLLLRYISAITTPKLLNIAIGVALMQLLLVPLFYTWSTSPMGYLNLFLLGQNIVSYLLFGALLFTVLVDRANYLRNTESQDLLTGLYNRRFFKEESARFLSAAERHEFPISLIIIDIDKFDDIKNNFGYFTGDNVIVKVADVIRTQTRKEDFLARLGNKEFVVLLPQTRAVGAALIAERMREQIESILVKVENQSVKFTASFGVTSINEFIDIDTSLIKADLALKQAKSNGFNQVVCL